MDFALGVPALVALIGIALIFDMLNGLHDAANSIATVVSTRVHRADGAGRGGAGRPVGFAAVPVAKSA
jgi:hypothetical protein